MVNMAEMDVDTMAYSCVVFGIYVFLAFVEMELQSCYKRLPMVRYVFSAFLLLIASLTAAAQTTKPIAAVDRVIIISIDGLRPDVLLRADAPNIRRLMAHGCFTFWARTTAVALTLPSHVSMMTGVIPVKHGIHWNEDLPLSKPYYPKVPTLFELARKKGLTTAMEAAKGKFDIFEKPGALNWVFLPPPTTLPTTLATQPMEKQSTPATTASDEAIARASIQVIKQHRPNVMLIHFASTDVIGHAIGWGTPEQVADVGEIDGQIGKILRALDATGLRGHTAIIITSDHGGAGRTHGADDPRSRHIPWIIVAPGIRENYDLARLPELTVNTYDTFATACWLLGIRIPAGNDGKPIVDILPAAKRELMK